MNNGPAKYSFTPRVSRSAAGAFVASWLARKDSTLRSPDPEDSQRFRRSSVRFERGGDSDSVDPAGNQVEHAGRSQVNVIRSRNSGIDRIAVDGGGEGEGSLVFPLTPQFQLTRRAEMSIWQSGQPSRFNARSCGRVKGSADSLMGPRGASNACDNHGAGRVHAKAPA